MNIQEMLSHGYGEAYANGRAVGRRRALDRHRVTTIPRSTAHRLGFLGKPLEIEDRKDLILLSLRSQAEERTKNELMLQTNAQFVLPFSICRRWGLVQPTGQIEIVDLADRVGIFPDGGVADLLHEGLPGTPPDMTERAAQEVFSNESSLMGKVAVGGLLRQALGLSEELAQA